MSQLNCRFTAYVYPAYVALLLFGPQDRSHNFGLNLFWDYWWPGIFLVYPFLGRVWCSVCPFMIFGELTQRWQLSRGVVLRKWPHAQGQQCPFPVEWGFIVCIRALNPN
jgi:polyferredoxin